VLAAHVVVLHQNEACRIIVIATERSHHHLPKGAPYEPGEAQLTPKVGAFLYCVKWR
jgi:hypothetical protein